MNGVKNRVALVTGAGSPNGIGFATAKLLKGAGARVAITSTTDRIFDRRNELGGSDHEVYAWAADLTESDAVTELHQRINSELGPVDILVNNAGMVQIGRDE
ncbi:MAG: SDR family NAD(P)-dependent oxidoreductase, partial [Arenicellales bacterium]